MAKLKWAMHYFLLGIGSVMTAQAGPKPSYLTRPIKDSLAKDWEAVGHDLTLSMEKFPEELKMVQPELGLESNAEGSSALSA